MASTEELSVLRDAILATTQKFIQSYVDAGQARKPELVSSALDDACVRSVGPPPFLAAVGAPADLTMDNATYAAEFNTLEFYTMDRHVAHDVVVDVGSAAGTRKAAARSTLHGTWIDGTPFERHFVWFLEFSADGSKVVRVYQHNDTKENVEFRERVKEWREGKRKIKAKEEEEVR
ncbi:hypothetical protein F4778DRAFT_269274 [Xylariomycetidae sp. FL2044]|nr:hypothetical protein F4778DRAFT_269274 [Xylariomycetidae sp. FL2044]